MNIFRKHIPSFVDCRRPLPDIPFATTEDLLKIPDVASWKEDKGFDRYVISGNHLMAIFKDGFEWWVVGYIKDPATVNLPKWDGGKYRALLDGKEVVLTKEVESSCGDELKLYDGRIAKNLRK